MSKEVPPDDSTTPSRSRGFSINEDWAATIVGLVLLLLVLVGAVPTGVIF